MSLYNTQLNLPCTPSITSINYQFNAAAEKALTELYQLIIADVLSLKQLDHNYLAGFISNVYDIGLLSISRMHLFYIPQISHG